MTEVAWLAALCAGAGAGCAAAAATAAGGSSEAEHWLERRGRARTSAPSPRPENRHHAVLDWVLGSARRRRERLQTELVPLLELLSLELGAGQTALSGLAAVCSRLEGPLARDLRRLQLMSQVAGSAPFEARLEAYADRLQLPAVASLASVLHASRDYGAGALPGVRALAADLRRAQRRQLIALSRRALNQVLAPAAFGILLPFLGILLFPALSTLSRSLR
ncbi:MAG TPA: hypothetical protein VK131_07770 [Candidatus Acidoferrales bacterium]|nr:hypothetical protein [Candidatus Acidoferrales bacterium]